MSLLTHRPNLNTPTQGFALVIALSLMAFVLLLLLSITTLTHVETNSSKISQNQLLARQNALLGIQVGLGRLQASLGPDTRVSARAELYDADASNAEITGVTEPAWTGVWRQPELSNASSFPEGLDPRAIPELVTWLVSGNSESDPLEVSPQLGIVGSESVELASFQQPASGLSERPRVTVQKESMPGSSYAFWVSDEGVKAKLNAVIEDYENDPTIRFLPEGNGITAFSELGDAGINKEEDWRSVYNLPLISATAIDDGVAAALSYDSTFYGAGVLADSLRGGLRYDLSTALSLSTSRFASDFSPLMPGQRLYEPYQTSTRFTGPRWDVFRQFASLSDAATGIGYEATPWLGNQTATVDLNETTQLAIAPIIERFQVYVVVRLGPDENPDPTIATYRPRLYLLPTIVLWNPYDKPINASNGYRLRWDRQGGLWAYNYAAGEYDTSTNAWQAMTTSAGPVGEFPDFIPSANSSGVLFALNASSGSNTVLIPPGESRVFTLNQNHDYSRGTTYTMVQGFNNFGFYQDADDTFSIPEDALGNPPEIFLDLRARKDGSGTALEGSILSLETINNVRLNYITNLRWEDTITASDTVSEIGGHVFGDDLLGPEPFPVTVNSYSADNVPVHSQGDPVVVGYEIEMIQPQPKSQVSLSEISEERPLARLNPRAVSINTPRNSAGSPTSGFYFRNPSYTENIFVENQNLGQQAIDNYTIDIHGANNDATYLGFSDTTIGSEQVAYFELRDPSEAILSVGQLRHFDLMSVDGSIGGWDTGSGASWDSKNFGPAFIIGEARADPSVPLNQYSNNQLLDHQWIANRQVWDRFFFSTIPSSGPLEFPLTNGKIIAASSAGATPAADLAVTLSDFKTASTALLIDGAFNVNSTSVRAWEALFSQYFGQSTTTLSGSSINNSDYSPFLDLTEPLGAAFPDSGGSTATDELYTGFRRLSRPQITALAEAMVTEVKQRGPFLSLSEFVNRRIRPDSNLDQFTDSGGGLSAAPDLNELASDPRLFGALQAAIEKSGLNDAFEDNYFARAEQAIWSTTSFYANKPALMGAYMEGAPGYLTQGKLLQRLGPVLSARSDTFIIRAYGESLSPLNNERQSEVYCEAVVQRMPEYVDPVDSPEISPNALTAQVNQTFGRRFKIINFKWIDKDSL
jgi:hypothetical protein